MKQAMRKGLVSLITGAATVASPMAFAAQDSGGMRYTSAAEGFYASIRTEYTSGDGMTDSGSHIDDSTSRFGVQGTNDLGGGMEGFYRYEVGTGVDNGDGLTARLRYVGLRGGFGDIRLGTIWDDTYNFVTSKTDLTQNDTGANAWYFRINNAIQYNTPDLNGFQASLRTTLKNEVEDGSCGVSEADEADEDTIVATKNDDGNYEAGEFEGNDEFNEVAELVIAETGADENAFDDIDLAGLNISCSDGVEKDTNDLDSWALSAQYSVQGFNIAATYEVVTDGLGEMAVVSSLGEDGNFGGEDDNADEFIVRNQDDLSRWGLGASYSQDNWLVATWYGIAEARSKSEYNLNIERDADGEEMLDGDGPDIAGVIHDEDEEIFSVGAQVEVDKVRIYGVYDSKDNVNGEKGVEDTQASVGVQYNLGAQSRVWIEYISLDKDSATDEDDFVNIGLRHDF